MIWYYTSSTEYFENYAHMKQEPKNSHVSHDGNSRSAFVFRNATRSRRAVLSIAFFPRPECHTCLFSATEATGSQFLFTRQFSEPAVKNERWWEQNSERARFLHAHRVWPNKLCILDRFSFSIWRSTPPRWYIAEISLRTGCVFFVLCYIFWRVRVYWCTRSNNVRALLLVPVWRFFIFSRSYEWKFYMGLSVTAMLSHIHYCLNFFFNI